MTDRRVFRYRLPITDHVVLEMPTGAEVLSVGPPRDGFDDHHLLAGVDTRLGRFIGTVPTHGGSLIWHVFEVAR
jgi:hypothetical protein